MFIAKNLKHSETASEYDIPLKDVNNRQKELCWSSLLIFVIFVAAIVVVHSKTEMPQERTWLKNIIHYMQLSGLTTFHLFMQPIVTCLLQ